MKKWITVMKMLKNRQFNSNKKISIKTYFFKKSPLSSAAEIPPLFLQKMSTTQLRLLINQKRFPLKNRLFSPAADGFKTFLAKTIL